MIIGLLKSIHQELKVWENTYGGTSDESSFESSNKI
jgi:hypothetical protein